ncbi:tryptophan synthase subunit beta [Candidatus Nomurabacteria bacterium RIFOXYC2_FULL_36_8]|nr:MAG: Tryptophan synthase beta chain [Candidatus Nomurabacteria bacterium GW2011_GWE2_36_115]KKP94181.1 MAG: Tryptophan synthase beta chain [Candidatus Nomurabacteria bacterium GW2011_GWF2_36_126]KKP96691.1 MAG: Tryptophan synthase beta chain [Candidatus Nomurabacteria bacterium GW2011_GWD2_36_14]KKP99705.1 MAG: Tryptophan synthase beta chain [Candidatus Nomurabacteria bacterium GW2011_GWF2_36_19]KKQ05349.1 MAG: Tryptophan synthase beta chain [Candidatus Nomurabacteria bacterium GW2011_GWF1_3
MKNNIKSLKNLPDESGYYGKFGGSFIPPQLVEPLKEIEREYIKAKNDPDFQKEYRDLLTNYVGRPSPLYFAKNLSTKLGGAKIYLKREDLNHTGAHKINHCLGEVLLAKRMGKNKVLAETGAGQHGVALATAAALLGLECEIHMGSIDIEKEHPNVIRMKLLGAKVVEVTSGGKCLKDAVDSAFATFINEYKTTFFAIGSVVGPHPYPMIVRDFQSIVGKEAKEQILKQEDRLPDYVIGCVGGGSNAIGLFHEFLDDEVKLVGVEPAGIGSGVGEHAATITYGTEGVIHGMKTIVLQDKNGEPNSVHSIASGLDYPGVGPIHAYLKDIGRVEYTRASDDETIKAFLELSKVEGIIPALESAHAIAYVMNLAPTLSKDKIIIVNLSGRGDKDIDYVAKLLKI